MTTRISRISAGTACLVAALAGAVVSSAAADGADTAGEAPTFREFEAATYVDVDGAYVVNGDEVVSTRAGLRAFYDRMVGLPFGNHDRDTHDADLVVNTVGGVDDKWSSATAANLTYCVSTRFGSRHAVVAAAMSAGAGLWEAASSRVNFVHVTSQDGSCNVRNNSVVFSVEPVSTSQYIARAFFPSTSKRQRNVLIDDSIWSSGNWEPGDILGHELGHVLGFRHEHTRPEAGACFEDNNWRPLTPYDAASIMHYPQCNGSSSDLEFQASDAAGLRALYGS
ncbi:hypothetical protein GCM10025786_16700 [Nocardioides caeni]